MFDLVTDLTELASSGEHGAALAAALTRANAPEPRHHGLIFGLFNLYSTLVAIGYFEESAIRWPPHSGQDGFDAAAWISEGLTHDAAIALSFLTFPTDENSEASVFSPNMCAQRFWGPPDHQIRDPRYQGDESKRLPVGYFLLSPNYNHVPVLVYDSYHGQIGWWDIMGTSWTGPEAVINLDWHPARSLLNGIVQRVLNLEVVPVTLEEDPLMMTRPPPEDFVKLPEIRSLDFWYINELNKFLAQKYIFVRHGWPGPECQRQEAVAAMREFEGTCQELESELPQSGYDWEAHRASAEAYARFFNDAAGPTAVNEPSFEECSDPFWARIKDF